MNSKNIDLKKIYNRVFVDDDSNFFTCNLYEESTMIIDMCDDWKGKTVLEIGCGTGNLASMIRYTGVKHILAVDYSSEAIKRATEKYNLSRVKYRNCNYKDVKGKYDIIVMQGVLEHLDNPFQELDYIRNNLLSRNGIIITSSPSFLNPRGYVWMTLATLFNVPMSLTDLHFLCPFDFKTYCEKNNLNLEYKSGYQDWGSGETTIRDFKKRLVNALSDANMDNSKVPLLLEWMEKAIPYSKQTNDTGAIICYKISK